MAEDIIDDIYEAGVVPERWPQLLDRLAGMVDAEGAILFVARQQGLQYVVSPRIAHLAPIYFERGYQFRDERTRRLFDYDRQGFVADLVKLRADLRDGALLAGEAIDLNRVFVVPAGCRLLRNVEFYRSPHRTLALDVIYPSEPHTPVGSVLEFSCDNQNRMSNGSLAFCTDTLLPVAALGHPVLGVGR